MIFIAMTLEAKDNALFISSLISDGERTPLFTDNAEYASVNQNYGKQSGKITYVGERNLYKLGESARNRFESTGVLPTNYDPKTIFIRCPNDNASILSGYSYAMGLYPTTLEGVDLLTGFSDLSNLPVNEKEVNSVRDEIGITKPQCGDQRLDIYPGNSDREYLIKPNKLYPGLKDSIKNNMNKARVEFEGKYRTKLYDSLAKAMNKNPTNINFENAVLYLDDYITAKANGQQVPYTLDSQTESLVDEYYTYYFERGLFGDATLTRVFTSSYFTNLGKELLAKHAALTDGRNADRFVRALKHAVHVSNDQTFAAVMHQLGERHGPRPSFARQVDWILFERGGEFYVKAESAGRPLRLEGNANEAGEVELGIFIEYV